MPTASAQFTLEPEGGNDTETGQATSTPASPTNDTTNGNAITFQNRSTFLLRGLIGTTSLMEDGAGAFGNETNQQDSDYVMAGRWRLFVEDGLVQRFVANFTLARTDGSQHYNIIIEDIGTDSEFADDASEITTQIYADSTLPTIVAPVTIEVEGRVLRITDIDIDEDDIEDVQQREILSIIDGQSIYGIVEFQGTG
ncbi:MAG: lipocalin [Thermoproteota archaeon]